MKRYDCLRSIQPRLHDELVVTNLGAVRHEWQYLRPHAGNYHLQNLGLTSSMALGLALALPHRKVIAFDGDGSLLLNLGSLATIANQRPQNLVHIVFDNEVYEASGKKKTATSTGTDLVGLACAAGIHRACWANSIAEFSGAARQALTGENVSFIGVKVGTERAAVSPYPIDEVENKYRFIRHVEKTERIEILRTSLPASYD